jgi:hypothetical protein
LSGVFPRTYRAQWFAISTLDPEETQWLEDTCAGGKWTPDIRRAKVWRSEEEAWAELDACDIDRRGLECFEVRL